MTTSQSDNKEIIRRLNEEAWGEGNLDLVDDYVSDGYVEHNSASPEPIRGPEGYRENVEMVRAAFPDMDVTVDDLIQDGDKIAYRYSIVGTHEEPFMGIEPTGVEVEIAGTGIAQIENGQLVEGWSIADVMGTMQQLGVIDPPG